MIIPRNTGGFENPMYNLACAQAVRASNAINLVLVRQVAEHGLDVSEKEDEPHYQRLCVT